MPRFAITALVLTLCGCGNPRLPAELRPQYLDASNMSCRQIVEYHNAKVEQSSAFAKRVARERGTTFAVPSSFQDRGRDVPNFTTEEARRYLSFSGEMKGAREAFERKGCGRAADMYKLYPVR